MQTVLFHFYVAVSLNEFSIINCLVEMCANGARCIAAGPG